MTQQVIQKVEGRVDDVVITCDTFGLEQMNDKFWWAAVYRGDKQTAFHIIREGRKVVVEVTVDEIGCIDDTVERT